MDKKDVVFICSGVLFSNVKEENNAICSNMDAIRYYHTKWSKPEKERQIPYDITYMCNLKYGAVQISSVAQSCPILWDPMNHSTPGLPVRHQLPEFTQTHVHQVGDAIQPSHPLSSPSPPALNPSQHQDVFQWVSSSHEVAKVLEFQLQHQYGTNESKKRNRLLDIENKLTIAKEE